MWILVITLTVIAIKSIRKRNYRELEKLNTTILFISGLGLLFSRFYRIMGMYSAFSVLETTRDISPTLITSGLIASLVTPLYSLIWLLVTGII
nr:hypothetical protein [uncultured Draconibacterium sp.]